MILGVREALASPKVCQEAQVFDPCLLEDFPARGIQEILVRLGPPFWQYISWKCSLSCERDEDAGAFEAHDDSPGCDLFRDIRRPLVP